MNSAKLTFLFVRFSYEIKKNIRFITKKVKVNDFMMNLKKIRGNMYINVTIMGVIYILNFQK